MVYVAFVMDVCLRCNEGWRASSSKRTDLPLDAVEQALYDGQVDGPLIHHSERGSRYPGIRCSERLATVGIEASVGNRGDSDDHALAESVIGLFKTEVIHHAGGGAGWRTSSSPPLNAWPR